MANPEHVEIVKRGADAIAEWQKEHLTEELDLRKADLNGSKLDHACLYNANLHRSNLQRAKLDHADVSHAILSHVDLTRAYLHRADLRYSEVGHANLRHASLRHADLRHADLRHADLSRADLSFTDLSGSDLTEAILSGVLLRNANLNSANLSEADLRGADLSGGDLTEAKSLAVNLSGAKLLEAVLCHTELSNANLSNADLTGANLTDAKLSFANLTHANLSRANMHGTRLRSAQIGNTNFAFCDLRSVDCLETILHFGPSAVDSQALAKSEGKISDEFLRGCGFSPWEIEMAKLYAPDLTANEISEIVSTDLFSLRTDGPLYIGGVFISYSHADKGLADKLYAQLKEAGVSVWQDRHDMVAGSMNKQIQRELRLRDIVVLILSENSVKSDWVEHELKTSRQKEKDEDRDVLCPIRVDDSWKSKMDNPNWGHLTDKNILDFSKWKTKAFSAQFDKLLKGMKINYEVRKN